MTLIDIDRGKVHVAPTWAAWTLCKFDAIFTPHERREGALSEVTCKRCWREVASMAARFTKASAWALV